MGANAYLSWMATADVNRYIQSHQKNEKLGDYKKTEIPEELDRKRDDICFDGLEHMLCSVASQTLLPKYRNLVDPTDEEHFCTRVFTINVIFVMTFIGTIKSILTTATNLDEYPDDRKKLTDIFGEWKDEDMTDLIYLLIQFWKLKDILIGHQEYSLVVEVVW